MESGAGNVIVTRNLHKNTRYFLRRQTDRLLGLQIDMNAYLKPWKGTQSLNNTMDASGL